MTNQVQASIVPPSIVQASIVQASNGRRRKDSGFALLLVLLMASILAISLYMELPRLAFQSERQKEQLLMERGEQYKRAIGLFLRTNHNTRWPASIEELESYNNHRSLRKRYIDPMTGKDEWRLIHIQNGVLTDSVTNKQSGNSDEAHLANTGFIAQFSGLGDTGDSGATGPNPGMRRRASDGEAPGLGPDGAAGATGASGAPPSGAPGGPPGGIAGLMGIPTPPQNGQNYPGGLPGGGQPGGLTGGGLTGNGSLGGQQPVLAGAPPGFGSSGGLGNANGLPGALPGGLPGGLSGGTGAQSAAAGLLQNLLTQPRPGGLAGIVGQNAQSGAMGSGIAGVASKFKGESVMVYATRTDFSEWEFIYDPMKFQVHNPNGNGGAGIGTPVAQMGSNGGASNMGTPVSQIAQGQGLATGGMPGLGMNAGAPGGSASIGAGSMGAGSMGAGSMGAGSMGAGGMMTTSTLGAPAGGMAGSTPGGTASMGAAGGMPTMGSGTGFGTAGPPDIRPGKK